MATIVMFNGESAHNVIRDRVALDAKLFEARGHEVMVIDLSNLQSLRVPRQIDLFIGYQGWGRDIKLGDGSLLVERFGCPYAVMLGDHPIQHAARIEELPGNTVLFVASREHRTFLEQALQVQLDIRLFTSTVSASAPLPAVERDLPVLMVGQAMAPDDFLAGHKMPEQVRQIIDECLERAARNPHADPVADYMNSGYSRVLDLVGAPASAIQVGRLVDLAARYQYRWSYVQELRKLPVTFVGESWVAMKRQSGDAFNALPSLPYEELPGLYARAQIGLNLFAPYFDFHERLLDMMVQSAVAATAKTSWLSELFDFGTELLALPDSPADVAGWLDDALSDQQRLAQIGARGRAKVQADFNDETRIDRLLELVDEAAPPAVWAHG
ncbi:glycosyltransferase [Pyruvatibacter mobilis]|uniref:Glycosyltransferase n=1 Tax=Pyruvatibacter mobilis TaxID=1712261 RepID=A0A845Q742_9HYPH|nr:glycosyltransferase [Pyruvatibacter mobilis]NBG94325.1 glycosyltransferase [Pyruvatibacter mobilis]QJD76623.1 glycosyltransferase family 1 protein [Pyruvatibacter mobilis]GGD02016.1 hypothetical protein GCM10011587_02190 [Pyruvatibacter mobilis]